MAAAIFVILLGIWLRLREAQWVTVILAMGLVLAAEAFNTCVEKICDLVNPQKDERVRFIKDVSAAAVLLASLAAATVGLIIFFPLLVHHHF
jgi:diacylglycerol kinase (ATP)